MTVAETSRLRAALEEMAGSAESAKWGFEEILTRANFHDYFPLLERAGLFDASRNPGPQPVGDGYVRIEHWPAVDYLKKCAELAGTTTNIELASAILGVVRNVTDAIAANAGEPDNYHTFNAFAEILGLLPLKSVSLRDVNLAKTWLASKYDRGLVCVALDRGLMRKALSSSEPEDGPKVDRLLELCTEIRWEDDKSFGQTSLKPVTEVEDHWLRQFLQNNASALGAKRGGNAGRTLLTRVREVFGASDRGESILYRPAIEDHEQNHEWRKVENRVVEGLRDVLLSWVDNDLTGAKPFVDAMLLDDLEVVRRIAIHAVNEKWRVLEDCYGLIAKPEFFDYEHLHELYRLLQDRFATFSLEERSATLAAIRNLPRDEQASDPERSLRRLQVRWLSAIVGKGSDEADKWFDDLRGSRADAEVPDNPDFGAYMYVRSGFGPSPLAPEEIVALLRKDNLVARLNDFREVDVWDGPSVRSLADSVAKAVSVDFGLFSQKLSSFTAAHRPYQYGVLNGYIQLWRDAQRKPPPEQWDQAWPALVELMERLLDQPGFWTEPVEGHAARLTPTREWIPGLIAELIEAGTKRDEEAFEPVLLPRTRKILTNLLEHTETAEAPSDDPMSQAINSPRGKAIEALINHALRECRLSDKRCSSHEGTWRELHPIFEAELAKAAGSNFEFSTLVGCYLSNLFYLSTDWVQSRATRLFPKEHPNNLFCAVAGLAYSQATRPSYRLLADAQIVEAALDSVEVKGSTRERFIERIALAYIWGDERLDSPVLSRIIDLRQTKDLQDFVQYLWSVSNQKLNQEQVERVLSFWRHVTDRTDQHTPADLMALLARLVCYLDAIDQDDGKRLLKLAAYVTRDQFHQISFFEELARLAQKNAALVSTAIETMLDAGEPHDDYEGHLVRALRTIADNGKKEAAIRLSSRMRDMRGMSELYTQLTANS